MPVLFDVLEEVAEERQRQTAVWGVQNHPDGTGEDWEPAARASRVRCEVAAKLGALAWRHILDEEVCEAYAETDPVRLRQELIQVAAVAVQWIQAIDRRRAQESAA